MADTDDGFISLPPGIFDTSTLKAMPKPERPRKVQDDIVFVQATPGMPVAPPPAPEAPAVTAPPAMTPPAPPVPPQQVAPPAPAAPVAPVTNWVLVLADGSEEPVTGVVLLGRNPAPFAAWPTARLLAVVDSTQSVSKSHAAFEVDDSGLWVHDLNSTNGVWVVNGSDVTEVSPGRRVNVPAGASIELGDYVLTARRG